LILPMSWKRFFIYDAHARASDDPMMRKVISDIRDEEKAHVGELMMLLRALDPKEMELFTSGEAEVNQMLSGQ
jgi:uncharacterized protein